ncbi:hypothetical protein BDB01DRAFT_844557 [Pilobolus umbonatus]|nr:hypothetical protein BDB01DRAFT_844557 [Pilobolus umbonatus]
MMRTSAPSDPQADALIEWINSFENISHVVSQPQDLSDGIILFEVLSNIDFKWFKLIRSADVGDNWVLKINNLKKLYKLVSRYYEEVLDIVFSKLPVINLNAIAKDSNTREIITLCKLVLYIAVWCHDNEKYIQKIQQLSPPSQQNMMHIIDEMMKYTNNDQEEEPQQSSRNYTPRNSFVDDGTYRQQTEIARTLEEKEELEIQNKQLIDKHSELLTKYDKLESEKQDLQARLKDMDRAVAQANETGRADFIMRTEIEHLKQDLQRSEDTRQEQERRLDDQSYQIKELTRRAMEDQNHSLMDRNQKIEDEYRNVLAFKTLMDSYKDQVATLETKNNELVREQNRLEYELAQANRKNDLLEADRVRDSDKIQSLEDHLQEVQLGMRTVEAPVTTRDAPAEVDEMDLDDFNLNDSLEDTLKESNVTELKLSKRRLERQIKTLQEENALGRNQKAVVLQHLLDDANRLKNQFEKNYLEVSQERDILQSDMARIRENIPDSLITQSEHTMSLRLHIIELEKELKSMREIVGKLEARIAEGRFDDENPNNRSKYSEMEEKLTQLEDQTKKQLQQINKLLLEKDILQGRSIEQKDLLLEKERMNSEMKASLAAFEAKDDEPFKQQNAHLQQQAIQLQEQMHEVQIKLKKAKEFIKQQDKMLKESELGKNSENYDEAITSLKTEIALRDDELEKLKKQIRENRIQCGREQRLIISAWYDLSRRYNKELNNIKVSPNSWLGQQRRTLDNQLKRR